MSIGMRFLQQEFGHAPRIAWQVSKCTPRWLLNAGNLPQCTTEHACVTCESDTQACFLRSQASMQALLDLQSLIIAPHLGQCCKPSTPDALCFHNHVKPNCPSCVLLLACCSLTGLAIVAQSLFSSLWAVSRQSFLEGAWAGRRFGGKQVWGCVMQASACRPLEPRACAVQRRKSCTTQHSIALLACSCPSYVSVLLYHFHNTAALSIATAPLWHAYADQTSQTCSSAKPTTAWSWCGVAAKLTAARLICSHHSIRQVCALPFELAGMGVCLSHGSV